MPFRYLRTFADKQLPAVIEGDSAIDALEVLVMAGYAKAKISSKVRTLHGFERQPATLVEITRMGRDALRMFGTSR
ncbi:MAG: hypothetical protein KKC79_10010 [Gammaproteobacteria bacterium]|nr:hypothetical protein [Gammaproteobacteria bacterium]MBU1439788.1 hypothetical protein [Gammaproteobacteria bacterium]MBU2408967.1 hypothetical protein [Gammaproteobacteria bacterium]